MSKFFIDRPIVAIVIAIFTVIVGAVVVLQLPVALFPQIAPPEVQVTGTYVGADAQTIEQSVATPIEQQMSGVDNMNYMYSLNAAANGQMKMIVDFDVATAHRDPPCRSGGLPIPARLAGDSHSASRGSSITGRNVPVLSDVRLQH